MGGTELSRFDSAIVCFLYSSGMVYWATLTINDSLLNEYFHDERFNIFFPASTIFYFVCAKSSNEEK